MKTRYYTPAFRWKDTLLMFMTTFYLCHLPAHSKGQIAAWTFENITSAVPTLPIAASSQNPRVQATATLSGGNNNGSPDACSGSETWSTNFWPTGSSRETDAYLQFSVKTDPGETFEIDFFSFSSNASSSNSALSFDVYYSKNNFTTSTFLFSGSQSTGSCSFHGGSVGTSVLPGTTIRFRVYPYGQNIAAQAATIRIDNVEVSGGLLPIILTAFEGSQQDQAIQLRWTTAHEVNNDRFTVERSPDGISFRPVGTVTGAGNTNWEQHYIFRDETPHPTVNYYRLRQTDMDGATHLHPVITVYFHSRPSTADLRIWPSLIQDKLHISLPIQDSNRQLIVRDINGRTIRKLIFPGGRHEMQYDLGELPAGWYLIQYRTPQQLLSRRFLKS